MFTFGASQLVLEIKNSHAKAGDIRNTGLIPGGEEPLEEGLAADSSIIAWWISPTEETGGLQYIGLHRVRMTEVT